MDPQLAIRTRSINELSYHKRQRRRSLIRRNLVTVRALVTYHLHPTLFEVMITAPAVDLELFLSPYIHNEKADLEIEILNIIQPVIGKHNENIKWLDSLIQHQQGDNPDEE